MTRKTSPTKQVPEFSALFDIKALQELFERLHQINPIPLAILDLKERIQVAVGWQDICTKFHRANKESEKCCQESDAYIKEHLKDGPYVEYQCKNGLTDLAFPIIINDKHVATFFIGQFFYEGDKPEKQFFVKQAQKYKYDKNAYLKALSGVPVFSREKIKTQINFFVKLAELLTRTAEANIRMQADLRERRLLEKELKQSEKKYRFLIENGADIISVLETDGTITYESPSIKSILGYDPRELVGKSAFHFIHPDDRENVEKTFHKVLKNKSRSQTVKFRFKHKKRGWRTLEGIGKFSDEKKVVVNNRDVTAKERAEKALRISEKKLKTITDAARDAIIMIGDRGQITYWSNSAEKLFGYSKKEALDKDLHHLLAPEKYHEDYLRGMAEFKKKGQGEVIGKVLELEAFHRDGHTFPIEVSISAVRMENQWQAIGVVRDITKRKKNAAELEAYRQELEKLVSRRTSDLKKTNVRLKNEIVSHEQTEQSLRDSEEKHRIIFEAATDAMIIVDSNSKIKEVNPAACRHYGYSREEMLRLNPKDLIHPDYQNAFGQFMKEVVETGEFSGETIDVRKDGSLFNTQVSGTQIILDDEIHLLAIIRDVTKSKQYEQKLKETVRGLDRANKELEQFAYVASHDLQEPLRMVSSYMQLLERRYRDKLDGDALEFIDFAVEGAKRMKGLIEALLGYSRLQQRELSMENVDLNEVVEQSQYALKYYIHENKAVIKADNLPVVYADASQLIDLFQNLISNALKFRSEKTPYIKIYAEDNDKMWQLAVSDNGIGIDPAHHEIIFKVFQRLQSKNEYSGTGIGLAICKSIVEKHKGRIRIESAEGRGTTFYFTLPKKEV